jgi:zinc transporter
VKKDFIIEQWYFDGQNAAERLDSKVKDKSQGIWLHCNRASEDFEQWLVNEGIEETIVESLLAFDTRPRFQLIGNESFFLILRGVNLNPGKEPDDMITLRILYTPSRVITCSGQQSKAIDSVIKNLENKKGADTLELLIIAILNQVNAKIETVLDPIEHFIDQQDEDTFNKDDMNDISSMHKKLLKLNRFLKPQIHALLAMNKNQVERFESHTVNLANQLDTLQRIVDTIDFYIAQIDVINSRINQLTSEITNRNTYLLSIISGIFLPLGFLTGLFGINIGGMPGVENSQAFYWFCGLLMGLGIAEVLLLKRFKFL